MHLSYSGKMTRRAIGSVPTGLAPKAKSAIAAVATVAETVGGSPERPWHPTGVEVRPVAVYVVPLDSYGRLGFEIPALTDAPVAARAMAALKAVPGYKEP